MSPGVADQLARTAADAVAAGTWPGEEVPLAKVERVLDRQYREWRERAGADADGLVRTRIGTLLVVADDRDALAAALDDVRVQPGRHPSRCIGLLTLPPGRGRGASVRAFAHLAQRTSGRPVPHVYDEVVVEAAVPDEYLASVVLPLLLPEIPVFTWWLGTPPFGSEAMAEVLGVTDRLLVDSAAFEEPLRGLDRVARLTRAGGTSGTGEAADRAGSRGETGGVAAGGPPPSDLTWGRLTPWRELLASVFGDGRLRPALDGLIEVAVTANQPAAGLLLLGWLASRLGWELSVAAGAGAPADGGRARYRTGSGEVVASLTVAADPGPGDVIVPRLRLSAEAPVPVVVNLIEHQGSLRAVVEAAGLPGERLAGADCRLSDAQALSAELSVFGRDRTFEEALPAAVAWARGTRKAGR